MKNQYSKRGLEVEAQGFYRNLRGSNNPSVDLDFEADRVDSRERIFVDHKAPIDFESLEDKDINISGFPSPENVAYNMGIDSVSQEERFVGVDQGPKFKEDVLHLFNFKNIRNPDEKPLLQF